ncbi:unnamed protein product [Heligmosomoides polygyrus]|uniref:Helitron_like_N domain-containing protein n=1 Tax=Heligmosomoides polygyrus TaxID=6339 RepID=A0A183GHL5_HELPZ|nr:unnamed protein product [Heligmosomoides polygyrus]
MERLYNRKHGAKRKLSKHGDPVFVSYSNQQRFKWISGIVQERMGRVLYKVRVGHQIWIRHANQMRNRYIDENSDTDIDALIRDLRFGASPSFNFTAYFDTALH